MSMSNSDSAWDAFAGSVPVVNDRPDRYYCRSCRGVWASKDGKRGYNRCSNCGVIYSADALIRLAKPSDKFIHLLADSICVTVQRSHLASVWEQFKDDFHNRILAIEQGVDTSALSPAVEAMKHLTPPITPSVAPIAVATPVAMPSEADWEKWASTQEVK
jgi:hypothetical protein